MFPLHDNIPPRHTPYVTYLLLGITTAVFIVQLRTGDAIDSFIERWGMVPARVLSDDEADRRLARQDIELVRTPAGMREAVVIRQLEPSARGDLVTLITCIFLHGGWLHFLGNMWFLHIFGDNVEDRFGHFLYLVLYIGGGVLAAVAQIAFDPSSTVPTVGASGAIAAVMGAYIVLYPHAVVQTLIPLPPIFFTTFAIPAPIFLGIWFLIQLYNGTIGQMASSTGVAWWAHIGGFVAGLVAAGMLKTLGIADPPVPRELRHRTGFFG